MIRASIAIALAAALIAAPAAAPALAQPAPPAPAPTSTLALAPLTSLGSEDTSAEARKVEAAIVKELSSFGRAGVIGAPQVVEATKKAKKPHLRACDGAPACLAELGALVGATGVVFGELGGLGDVQVLSLGVVDVATGKELRRVQVSLAQADQGGVPGAVVRLFAPDRFVGQLVVRTPVPGATIYIDGKRLARSPAPPIRMGVGAHALRVTHPEHRDFVRFVDIAFGSEVVIDVALEKFASIESSVESTAAPVPTGPIRYVDGPPRWYRRWWAVAGFTAVVLGSAIAIGAAIDQTPDHDGKGTVLPP